MNSSGYFSSKSKPIQTPKLDIATAQIATSTTNGLTKEKSMANQNFSLHAIVHLISH